MLLFPGLSCKPSQKYSKYPVVSMGSVLDSYLRKIHKDSPISVAFLLLPWPVSPSAWPEPEQHLAQWGNEHRGVREKVSSTLASALPCLNQSLALDSEDQLLPWVWYTLFPSSLFLCPPLPSPGLSAPPSPAARSVNDGWGHHNQEQCLWCLLQHGLCSAMK